MNVNNPRFIFGFVLFFALMVSGCGGGGGGSASATPPPNTTTSSEWDTLQWDQGTWE